jgi:carboxylesterase type B
MLLGLVALWSASQFHIARAAAPLAVNTTSGTVQGFVNQTTPHVAQFLGIPFAEQPVGARRWLSPVRKANASGVIDAKRLGPACPQFLSEEPSHSGIAAEFLIHPPSYQSEDCLSLSIWAPQKRPSQGLPVVIWLYGGGFVEGGSNVPYQNPAPWVERTQKIIVVSIK